MIIAAALLFVFLLAGGVAVFLALGTVSTLLFLHDGKSMPGIVQIIVDHLNSNTLISVPFFVIAAGFMQKGGAAKALIDAADTWIGHRKGGLAMVCIMAAMVFSAISGSTTATALALGVILIPAMLERRYEQKFSVGIVGASGTLGTLIPPSLALIVFGLIANVSIPSLFLAGVTPGLIQAALFMIWAAYYTRDKDIPTATGRPLREVLLINLKAVPALLIPVLILGGIYSGMITVTEAAALAAVLSILIGVFIYKECEVEEIIPVVSQGIARAASIIFIIATAVVFSHWIIESGFPARLVTAIAAAELKSWQFLILMNIIMIALGMFLEVISVILITVPLVLPVLHLLDIDPIHYAVVVIVNMGLATLTPPVGLNLFVMQSISKASFKEVVQGVLPFVLIMAGLLMLVTFVPIISTWLPDAVYSR